MTIITSRITSQLGVTKARLVPKIHHVKKCVLIFSSIFFSIISVNAVPANLISTTNNDAGKSSVESTVIASKTVLLSFKQLGLVGNMQLAGFDGRNGVDFSARSDEVIVSGNLNLKYKYSPELLGELSSINIFLNGQTLSNIEIVKENGNKNLEAIIPIPANMIAEKNMITIQLVGHYALKCEDPFNPALWAQIRSDSTLELTTLPIDLPNNLAKLPAPFFDVNDPNKLVLPFILPNSPSNKLLESATVLSSWFSSLAGNRGAYFPVYINNIPAKGNAVILAVGQPIIANVSIAAPTGPTIAIVKNPNDPLGKLLFIMGKDSNELKVATSALVLQSQKLAGDSSLITQFAQIDKRKAYDAPKWLPSDRPVKFSSLANLNTLSVKGSTPQLIQVDLPVPPSLYSFNKSGLPIEVKYAYTNQFTSTKSVLSIDFNGEFVRSLPLKSLNKTMSRLSFGDNRLASFFGLAKTSDGLLSSADVVFVPMPIVYPNSNIDLNFDQNTYHQGDDYRIDGHRIHFDEIEQKILTNLVDSIKDITLLGQGLGKEARLFAYVVPKTGSTQLDSNLLRETLLEKLASYEVPSTFIVLDSLPLTPEGELDRSALPQPAIISKTANQSMSRLQLKYNFKVANKALTNPTLVKAGQCPEVNVGNDLQGTINPNSYIDISGLSHFSPMPNLGAFQSSGFPFTRYADLSETAVVLSDNPDPGDYTALLNMVGYLSKSSGYPATLVTVIQQHDINTVKDKDLLILASGESNFLPNEWSSKLPSFPVRASSLNFNDINATAKSIQDLFTSFFPKANAAESNSILYLFSNKNNALVTGFESPLSSQRSVVLVWGANSELLNNIVNAVQGNEKYYGNVLGALSLLKNKQVIPMISTQTYFTGHLPWYEYLQWVMSRNTILFILFSVVSLLLMTLLVYYVLKTKENKRLG